MSGTEERQGKGRKRHLVYEFTQETTFHGVRYVTEDTPYIVRRLLWVLILTACISAFVYIIVVRLIFLLDFPKAVNVEVIHSPALTFPAVTICNQNFFRKSRTFYSGYYDRVEDRFRHGVQSKRMDDISGCTDRFEMVKGSFFAWELEKDGYPISRFLDDAPEDVQAEALLVLGRYNMVSIRVCQQLCVKLHDALCNSLAYNYTSQTCFISKLSHATSEMDVVYTREVDTFMRRRCMPVRKCTFEDNMCPFYQPADTNFMWAIHSGHDHTLSYGHYMVTPPYTNTHLDDYFILLSPFVDADRPFCLKLYYHIKGSDIGLWVSTLDENGVITPKTMLLNTPDTTEMSFWREHMVTLGRGVFQVQIESSVGQGTSAIDDLTLGPCSQLVSSCLRDIEGRSYMGPLSVTKTGKNCVQWITATGTSNFTFPDSNIEAAENLCRNPDGNSAGPWCWVKDSVTGQVHKEECLVPLCECQENEFDCGNGLCINRLFTCDSHRDCPDGRDEAAICHHNVSCNFEGSYSCGYRNLSPSQDTKEPGWIQHRGAMRNGHVKGDHTTGTENGYYMYLDSSHPLWPPGKRVALISGPTNVSAADLYCLKFYTYTGRDTIFPDAMGSILIYEHKGYYDKRPLWVIHGENSHKWIPHEVNVRPTGSSLQIRIEAVFGSNYYSDMAIDDVEFHQGPCSRPFDCGAHPDHICDGFPHCLDFSDEDPRTCDSSVACNFIDGFACGYHDDSDPSVPESKWNNVPTGMQVDTRDFRNTDTIIKRLISPWTTLDSAHCLSFKYKFESDRVFCAMYVYQESPENRTLLRVVSNQGWFFGDGRTVYVEMAYGDRSRVSWEVNCTSSADSYVTLGPVQLEIGRCEDRWNVSCDFTVDNTCGYLDQSPGPSIWNIIPPGFEVFQDGGPITAASLLSPEFTSDNATVLEIDLYVDGGARLFAIHDLYDDEKLVWGRRNVFTGPPGHELLRAALKPGQHRLRITVELDQQHKLWIDNIILSEGSIKRDGTDGSCPHPGIVCEGTTECLFPHFICDQRDHCFNGEDEDATQCQTLGGEPPTIIDREKEHRMANLFYGLESLTPPSENLTTFYNDAGHQIENLLHGCVWAGTPCSVDDFVTEVTDYGLCHTINSGRDGRPLLETSNTGASSGLQLSLNVEQYEYMSGPQVDAGVKIFAYDQIEISQVRDLGFAIGPGQHALVGMSLSQFTTLAWPWGNCTKQSKHGAYTYSACVRECEIEALEAECKCRDAFMYGDPEGICSLTSYLGCVTKQKDLLDRPLRNCTCTEPCFRQVFSTQLSYASLSSLSVDQVLNSDLSNLTSSHMTALQVNHVTSPNDFIYEMNTLTQLVTGLKTLLRMSRERGWSQQKSVLFSIDKSLWFLAEQILQKDVEETMREKLNNYSGAFNSQYGLLQKVFETYSTNAIANLYILGETLSSWGKELEGSIQVLKEQLLKNRDMLIHLNEVVNKYMGIYRTGTVQTPSSSTNNDFHTPVVLTVDYEDCQHKLGRVSLTLSLVRSIYLDPYISEIESTGFLNDSTVMHERGLLLFHLNDLNDQFAKACECTREYSDFLSTVNEWINHVRNEIGTRRWFNAQGRTIDNMLDYVEASRPLQDYVNAVEDVVRRVALQDITLYKTAWHFDDEYISNVKLAVNRFKSQIISRVVRAFRDRILDLSAFTKQVYLDLFHYDDRMSRYFRERYDNATIKRIRILKHPRPDLSKGGRAGEGRDVIVFNNRERFSTDQLARLMSGLVEWYMGPLVEALDAFEEELDALSSQIDSTLVKMQSTYQAFRRKTKIDENFIKENFLAVDIYFSQLKYQAVQQIKAYDSSSFFSDVGGFMGLLLGGSVITLFEFFDLILFRLCLCPCRKRSSPGDPQKKRRSSGLQFSPIKSAENGPQMAT